MQVRIFKMTYEGIFINSLERIAYANTNLPVHGFDFVGDIYWKVAIETSENKTHLKVEVLEYNAKNLSIFNAQKIQGEVPFIVFLPFQYEQFKQQVACRQSGLMRSLCKDHPLGSKRPIHLTHSISDKKKLYSTERIVDKEHLKKLAQNDQDNLAQLHAANQLSSTINISFKHKFSDCTIKDGLVEFSRNFNEAKDTLIISVFNEHLKKEYDLLKEYFSNRLGKKTFLVSISLEIKGSEILSFKALSTDIDKIDQAFIEEIRFRQIQSLKRIAIADEAKKLLSVDEVFLHSEQFSSNIFNNDINDIIKELTNGYSHRNSPQIVFLAESHNAANEKVYLTLKPLFGFVFYITGLSQHHFIWELLDSHATYVWSFSKASYTQRESFEVTELAINEIHHKGRNVYKAQFKANAGPNFRFIPLDHELSENESSVVFETWKEKIESLILC